MTLIKKLSVTIIICALLTFLAFAVILLISTAGSYDFYYPDKDLKTLKSEKRRLDNSLTSGSPKDEMLIREYFLGPIRYDLKLPIDTKVKINNIWLISYKGETAAVINFNADFLDFIQSDRENAKWVLAGLIETLKAGTAIEKFNIYSDDKPLRVKLGNLDLAKAIQIRIAIKK